MGRQGRVSDARAKQRDAVPRMGCARLARPAVTETEHSTGRRACFATRRAAASHADAVHVRPVGNRRACTHSAGGGDSADGAGRTWSRPWPARMQTQPQKASASSPRFTALAMATLGEPARAARKQRLRRSATHMPTCAPNRHARARFALMRTRRAAQAAEQRAGGPCARSSPPPRRQVVLLSEEWSCPAQLNTRPAAWRADRASLRAPHAGTHLATLAVGQDGGRRGTLRRTTQNRNRQPVCEPAEHVSIGRGLRVTQPSPREPSGRTPQAAEQRARVGSTHPAVRTRACVRRDCSPPPGAELHRRWAATRARSSHLDGDGCQKERDGEREEHRRDGVLDGDERRHGVGVAARRLHHDEHVVGCGRRGHQKRH